MKAIPGSPGWGMCRSVARALPIVALASVLLVRTAAGQNVKLNAPLRHYTQGGVLESRASPDGRWCVYRATEGWQVAGLFSVRADGSESSVFFAADQTTDELRELFVAPVDQEKAARVVSGPFLPGSDVSAIEPTSDGNGILYLADQDTDSVVELFLSVLAPAFMRPPGASVDLR